MNKLKGEKSQFNRVNGFSLRRVFQLALACALNWHTEQGRQDALSNGRKIGSYKTKKEETSEQRKRKRLQSKLTLDRHVGSSRLQRVVELQLVGLGGGGTLPLVATTKASASTAAQDVHAQQGEGSQGLVPESTTHRRVTAATTRAIRATAPTMVPTRAALLVVLPAAAGR